MQLKKLEPSYEDDTAAFMSSANTSSCLTSVSRSMSGISETGNIARSKKRVKIDPLWEYFDETEKDRICRICRSSYSKKTGLTTLKDHFEKNHKKVHNELYIQTALPLDEKKVRASLCLKSWYETGLLESEYVNALVNVL